LTQQGLAKGREVSDKHLAFAERLKGLREAAGLSQYALAKRSGLTKQALSRLELGEREPTWVTVQLLAAALGVDCREFVDPGLKPPAPEPPRPPGRPRKGQAADLRAAQEKPARRKPPRPRGG
jgi:transcriptional regulator with XRE-family HTH domain